MMLTSQQRAVRAWVVAALADAGKPIPIERVVWGPQDSPPVARPYVLLGLTGSTTRSPRPELWATGDHGASTQYARTDGTSSVSITVVGVVARESLDDGAAAYLAELTPRLQLEELDGQPNPLEAANLAVTGRNEFPAVDRLVNTSQWETRATLDVTFLTAVVVTQTPGTVQTVEITGTTEPPPSLIGAFEVP